MTGELTAAYRLDLHAGFPFAEAAAGASYLSALGASHLFTSPILQSTNGSLRRQVVDPSRIDEGLGGQDGFDRLHRALSSARLGLLVQVVPRHLAIAGRASAWWWDVLENGPASQYASYFDIDWGDSSGKAAAKILVPILGEHYGRALDAGELRLVREGASVVVRYHDQEVPVSPRSLDELLARVAQECMSHELATVAAGFGSLPATRAGDREASRARHRDKEALRARLERLCRDEPGIATSIDAHLDRLHADPEALDALLLRQHYRLSYWPMAADQPGDRHLIATGSAVKLRADDAQVFADTHQVILRLLGDDKIDGLAVDDPDGLRHPEGYLRRLRIETAGAYVVADKVLSTGEALSPSWPVAGTTGHHFVNLVTGLFVDPRGEQEMTGIYTSFTGEQASFTDVAWRSRQHVLRHSLGAEVERLTTIFATVCEGHRHFRDYTRVELRDALRAALSTFPVHRSYVRDDEPHVTQDDAHWIGVAIDRAAARRPDIDGELMTFLGRVLVLEAGGEAERELALRFPQLCASVMVEGVEDTALYRYHRLVALNEVGSDPDRFGTSVEEFHEHNREAAERWPAALLGLSSGHSKRGEDVRARLALLSEIPAEWGAAVQRWAAMNERHRTAGLPDRNTEYLIYQTLVGAHPLDRGRAMACIEAAVRDAKVHTSRLRPDPAYEEALRSFVEGALGDEGFLSDLADFTVPLVSAGRRNSVAQTLLALTAPGIPLLSQGCELWDLGPAGPGGGPGVDVDIRRRLLAEVAALGPHQAWARADDGSPKLWLLHRALSVRQRHAEAFAAGAGYEPLPARGERAAHVVSFTRGDRVVAVVPRLVLGLRPGWGDTTLKLPGGRWVDQLSRASFGGEPRVGDLLDAFPVALLVRE